MNLQENIRDLSKELNYLYLTATPPDDTRIEKLIDALDTLSLVALKKKLDENTPEFKSVSKSLDDAKAAAEKAVDDLQKVGGAIATTVKVVKVLDKLLEYAGSLIV